MIAKDIKPFITHFTYQVSNADHMQEVIVGGKITSIQQTIPALGHYEIQLDDQIGDLLVVCSPECFFAYEQTLKVNQIVILHGIYNQKHSIVHAYRVESLSRRKLQ